MSPFLRTLALLLVFCVAPAWAAERDMHTIELPLRNGDFRDGNDSLDAWTREPAPSSDGISVGDGPVGQPAAWLDASSGARDLSQDVASPVVHDEAGALSVSAWVWSDVQQGALLVLSNGAAPPALSAFHSGQARWEYITVVLPFSAHPTTVRVTLRAQRGKARFARVSLLATSDDRFTKTLPDGCSPLRERATYDKADRVRVVIVGGSTVNGFVVADKRATFPYALQLKLEAVFPGQFDVVNFGICAWHLPPQIVTIDKAFNSNLWCDGAEWCHQEAAFSHRNALARQSNADANTPTLADMKPDVVIFAGMWNDVWRTLKFPTAAMAANPFEVRRIGTQPASVVYYKAALDYLDRPTRANQERADALLRAANRPLDPAQAASLSFDSYASLKRSDEFLALAANARQKFAFLSGEFIRRTRRHAAVWSLVLPGRLGLAYEAAGRRLVAAGMLPDAAADKFLMNGYIDALTGSIQAEELTRAARALSAPVLDLDRAFNTQYGLVGIGEQFALGYFLENLEDNAHFTYRGNEWIADQIYAGFADEFAALAARNGSTRGGQASVNGSPVRVRLGL